MDETTLIRRNIVEKRTGLARTTIYSMMKNGTFPQSVKVGKRAVRWRESDISAFAENPKSWTIEQAARRATQASQSTEGC